MKVLIAGFEGNTNSAKILLDNIKENKSNVNDILYLENDFDVSANQIEEKLELNYDYVLMFGQYPDTKKIYLERKANLDNITYTTDFEYDNLKRFLESKEYEVEMSNDAGNYFCNNVFFNALKFKENNNKTSKISFIHIPTIDNITDIQKLSTVMLEYCNNLED